MAVITIDDDTVTGEGTAPDAPSALTTEREWDAVRLHWANPPQRDVDYIQIWRHTANDRASATMVAQVKANDYTDHSLETGTRYYWIRAISTTGLEGAWHPTSATGGVSGIPEQVAITSAADKDVLQYESASSSWVNSPGIRGNTRLLGEMQATTNANYVFPPQTLNTITDNNGYSASSSFPAGTVGYGANASFTHYYGDTLAGTNTAPAFNFKNANGNSTTGETVPFTGITSVAPSATQSGNVMGTLNFNGYGTTGFTNDVASANQGGGINALQVMQIQSYPTEAFSDSVVTLTSTNVTAVASSFRVTVAGVTCTGTKGQFSNTTTTWGVGHAVRVTGTLTGNVTGVVSGGIYYVIVTNGSTTFTLSATPGGPPINTTGSTTTGLTFTRCGVTFTTTGLTTVPFGRGALVAVSGVTNITDGTYPVYGTPTTTALTIGIPHTVAPTVSGSQSFACRTSYNGSGFRIRAFPLATPTNLQNRLEIIDHTPASATYRADTFAVAGGAYGNTGSTRLTVDSAKITAALPVVFPNYTVATLTGASPTLVGAVGWQVAVSDSPTYAGRMAYWSTTATAGWRYIDDNSAV
jgi:hypothetical protein